MIRNALAAALLSLSLTACGQALTPAQRVTASSAPAEAPGEPLDPFALDIDKARETENWLEGELAIGKVPVALVPDYIKWFEPRARDFPPLWLYASARKLEEGSSYVKAAFWYLAARERHLRHLRRCRDETAREALIWADAAFESLRRLMAENREITEYAAKHAFAWLDIYPDTDAGLLLTCSMGAGQGGALVPAERGGRKVFILTPPTVSDPAKWLIPAAEVNEPRIWSRILMKKEVAKILGEPEDLPPLEVQTPLR